MKKFNTDDAMKQQVASRERALIEKLSAEAAMKRQGKAEIANLILDMLKTKGTISEKEIQELLE